MSGLARGLVGLALLGAPAAAHAQAAAPVQKAPAEKASEPAPAPADPSADNTAPAPPPEKPTVRVYLRSGIDPVLFSARAASSDGTPSLCTAPCDMKVLPGDYRLRLNGVPVEGEVKLTRPGTLEGKFHSREAGREGAWLALNVGGILGGVFVTIAALGGPSWTYIAGGGSLLGGGAIFVLTYRSDSATVSFSPSEPQDLRALPPPIPTDTNSSGPMHNAGLDRPGFAENARGLGFRVTF